MAEQTPAEKAVEIITRELPGFALKIDAGRNEIFVRGMLKFGTVGSVEAVYLVPENVEIFAAHLIEQTRRNAIAMLGLDELMRRELQRARHEAYVAAFAEGKAAGVEQGRRDALAEIIAAQLDAEDSERATEEIGLGDE